VEWIGAAVEGRSSESLRQLCRGGEIDRDALVRTWSDLYLYLIARNAGASEAQARQQVIDALEAGAESTKPH
jgi:hypothetical protein